MAAETPSEMEFDFLKAPYDVRRAIYELLYPTNTHLLLTRGKVPAWAKQVEGPSSMPLGEKNLLRTCSKVRDEVYRTLYGTNTFVLVPGADDYRHPTLCVFDSVLRKNQMFISNKSASTRAMIKSLHLLVGYECGLIDFGWLFGIEDPLLAVVEIDHSSVSRHSDVSFLREVQKMVCGEIVLARYQRRGKQTLWKDHGVEEVAQMLRELMPLGYEKA